MSEGTGISLSMDQSSILKLSSSSWLSTLRNWDHQLQNCMQEADYTARYWVRVTPEDTSTVAETHPCYT